MIIKNYFLTALDSGCSVKDATNLQRWAEAARENLSEETIEKLINRAIEKNSLSHNKNKHVHA